MKRYSLITVAVLVCVLSAGCATHEDLLRTSGVLDSRLSETARTVKDNEEAIASMRKTQANGVADIMSLQKSVQELRGSIEELQQNVSRIRAEGVKKDKETKVRTNGNLDGISMRVSYIENYLGIGKKEGAAAAGNVPEAAAVSGTDKMDKEKVYADAYATFKNGDYASARSKFEAFQRSFPQNEYSDNAQFWIGETYYFEGSYEKSILEYDKVIQKYPKGNKVPNALLKQAMAFLKLGDKASSKLLFQRVIRDYPSTTPAKIARARLSEVK